MSSYFFLFLSVSVSLFLLHSLSLSVFVSSFLFFVYNFYITFFVTYPFTSFFYFPFLFFFLFIEVNLVRHNAKCEKIEDCISLISGVVYDYKNHLDFVNELNHRPQSKHMMFSTTEVTSSFSFPHLLWLHPIPYLQTFSIS